MGQEIRRCFLSSKPTGETTMISNNKHEIPPASLTLVEDAVLASHAEVRAKHPVALVDLHAQALFNFGVEFLERDYIHDVLLARYFDRAVLDRAHAVSDEIDDRVILAHAGPGGDVAGLCIQQPVKKTQAERARTG